MRDSTVALLAAIGMLLLAIVSVLICGGVAFYGNVMLIDASGATAATMAIFACGLFVGAWLGLLSAERLGWKAKPLAALLVLLLLPTVAQAQATITSGFNFDNIAPPQAVNWDLFDGSTHLDLSVAAAPCCQQVLSVVTQADAVSQGINWSDWSTMFANGPKSLTSSITFAGVTHSDSLDVPDNFALSKLQIWAMPWHWPVILAQPNVRIVGLASGAPTDSPEPRALFLMLLGLMGVVKHSVDRHDICGV